MLLLSLLLFAFNCLGCTLPTSINVTDTLLDKPASVAHWYYYIGTVTPFFGKTISLMVNVEFLPVQKQVDVIVNIGDPNQNVTNEQFLLPYSAGEILVINKVFILKITSSQVNLTMMFDVPQINATHHSAFFVSAKTQSSVLFIQNEASPMVLNGNQGILTSGVLPCSKSVYWSIPRLTLEFGMLKTAHAFYILESVTMWFDRQIMSFIYEDYTHFSTYFSIVAPASKFALANGVDPVLQGHGAGINNGTGWVWLAFHHTDFDLYMTVSKSHNPQPIPATLYTETFFNYKFATSTLAVKNKPQQNFFGPGHFFVNKTSYLPDSVWANTLEVVYLPIPFTLSCKRFLDKYGKQVINVISTAHSVPSFGPLGFSPLGYHEGMLDCVLTYKGKKEKSILWYEETLLWAQ